MMGAVRTPRAGEGHRWRAGCTGSSRWTGHRARGSPRCRDGSPRPSAPPTSTPARCTAPSRSPCSARVSSRAARTPRRSPSPRPRPSGRSPTPRRRSCCSTARTSRPRSAAPQVTRAVSAVSAKPQVRAALVEHQREIIADEPGDRRRGPRHRQRRHPGRPAEGLPHRVRGDPRRAAGARRTARPGAPPTTPPSSPTSAAATSSTPPARRPRCTPPPTRSCSTPTTCRSTPS